MYRKIKQHILDAYAKRTPSSGDPYCDLIHEIRTAFRAEQITRDEYTALFYILGKCARLI